MELKVDNLSVKISKNRILMGTHAASEAATCLKRLLEEQQTANIIFAAAPSQNEFLDALSKTEGIDWRRVNAFHMDEYIGLDKDAPQGFGNFLREHIFSQVPFRTVFYLNGQADNIQEACQEYTDLLLNYPADIVFMGIGENGHIAFNDPHVADFQDPYLVKIVDLDEKCRQQQVNDGCFSSIAKVPTHALTLTIPALYRAGYLFCMVPGKTKAWAVNETLTGAVSVRCPASILRNHPHATLYIDNDSSSIFMPK